MGAPAMESLGQFKVPTFPVVARESLTYIFKSEVDFDKLSKSIGRDVGISANILRLANSAHFLSGKPTSDLKIAVSRIGLSSLTQILISHSLEATFRFEESSMLNYKAYMRHSAHVGLIALELANANPFFKPMATDLQLAGLMHDIGIAAIAGQLPGTMATLVNHAQSNSIDFATSEQQMHIEPHRNIGAMILKQWALPDTVQLLVQNHDIKNRALRDKLSETEHLMVDLINLADTLAHRFGSSLPGYSRDTRIDAGLLRNLKFTTEQVLSSVKNANQSLTIFSL